MNASTISMDEVDDFRSILTDIHQEDVDGHSIPVTHEQDLVGCLRGDQGVFDDIFPEMENYDALRYTENLEDGGCAFPVQTLLAPEAFEEGEVVTVNTLMNSHFSDQPTSDSDDVQEISAAPPLPSSFKVLLLNKTDILKITITSAKLSQIKTHKENLKPPSLKFDPLLFEYNNIDQNYKHCEKWITYITDHKIQDEKALKVIRDHRFRVNSLDKMNFLFFLLFTLDRGVFLRLISMSQGRRIYGCMDCNKKLFEIVEVRNKSGEVINFQGKFIMVEALEHRCSMGSIAIQTLKAANERTTKQLTALKKLQNGNSTLIQADINGLKKHNEKEQESLRQTFDWFKHQSIEAYFLEQSLTDIRKENIKSVIKPLLCLLILDDDSLFNGALHSGGEGSILKDVETRVLSLAVMVIIHLRFGMRKTLLQSYTNPRGLNPVIVFEQIKDRFQEIVAEIYDSDIALTKNDLEDLGRFVGRINRV
ncbi:hypothetical protein WICPIJ_009828 [Wickerhamomyces pijperi]|uniref:Uncharacterized protein n=1 Tax=Wickerhamomyces pijperi TaxID=599730 RepID=A0A9P8PKX9_WICPI|nr:hypothetical protein WICPIJ_009828 [Wickerhamomyces pijperi]